MNKLTVPPQGPLTPWPSAKQLKQLAHKLYALNGHYQAMCQVRDAFEEAPRSATKDELATARRCVEQYESSDLRTALLDADFDMMRKDCIPTDWWNEQDEVQESAVARMVALLLGAFPNGAKDPEIFVNTMIEDAHGWNPHYFAMHDACWALRQTLKFTPSIAELKQAYDKAMEKWMERWDAEEFVEDAREMLIELIAIQEKAATIRCGCRVRNAEFGVGTVDTIENYGSHYYVQFESSQETRKVRLSDVEKLMPGDDGFTPPPKQAALEHKPSVVMQGLGPAWARPDAEIVPAMGCGEKRSEPPQTQGAIHE